MGLGKSYLNGVVTILQGPNIIIIICTAEYNLGLSKCDCNGEVTFLVRFHSISTDFYPVGQIVTHKLI